MSTAVSTRAGASGGRRHRRRPTSSSSFGITGDLAKVMTFRSLYRLERARPARLPDRRRGGRRLDASTTCASTPATAIDGDRRDARRGGLRALRRAAVLPVRATSATPPPTSASPPRSRARSSPVFYLEIPPFLFGTRGQGPGRRRPDRERARRGREAVRPRPRVRARARRRDPRVHRRVAAVPDRPLPREDGPRRDPLPALRQHDARAGLEPQLRRVACRSRWPRTSASRTAATSTTRSARCATSSSTT